MISNGSIGSELWIVEDEPTSMCIEIEAILVDRTSDRLVVGVRERRAEVANRGERCSTRQG